MTEEQKIQFKETIVHLMAKEQRKNFLRHAKQVTVIHPIYNEPITITMRDVCMYCPPKPDFKSKLDCTRVKITYIQMEPDAYLSLASKVNLYMKDTTEGNNERYTEIKKILSTYISKELLQDILSCERCFPVSFYPTIQDSMQIQADTMLLYMKENDFLDPVLCYTNKLYQVHVAFIPMTREKLVTLAKDNVGIKKLCIQHTPENTLATIIRQGGELYYDITDKRNELHAGLYDRMRAKTVYRLMKKYSLDAFNHAFTEEEQKQFDLWYGTKAYDIFSLFKQN